MGLDAQQQHDQEMVRRAVGKKGLAAGSRQRLEALLKAKGNDSASSQRFNEFGAPVDYNPLAALKARNPGLTEEKIEEMAKEFGF
jgi:hypothetical protein